MMLVFGLLIRLFRSFLSVRVPQLIEYMLFSNQVGEKARDVTLCKAVAQLIE